MVARETLRARQAALLLHGLPADARGRVLARLSADEAARLQPLLKELADLGVSPSLSRELQDAAPASMPAAPGSATARERAESLSGTDVAKVLQACAPATVAAILKMAEWPWKQEVLALSSELRRVEIQRHLRGDALVLPPAVGDALCERLCQEVMQWTR